MSRGATQELLALARKFEEVKKRRIVAAEEEARLLEQIEALLGGPRTSRSAMPCRHCDGHGELDGKPCARCGGTRIDPGTLPPAPVPTPPALGILAMQSELRDVPARAWGDPAAGLYWEERVDTGEVYGQRPLTDEDRQGAFPLDGAE